MCFRKASRNVQAKKKYHFISLLGNRLELESEFFKCICHVSSEFFHLIRCELLEHGYVGGNDVWE